MTGTRQNRLTRRVGALRRLAEPDPIRVRAGRDGQPVEVGGRDVMSVRESWLVEDRWWTSRPIRRHYWEVVDSRGSVTTIFREPGDRWMVHR